jgi:hypothetical protein
MMRYQSAEPSGPWTSSGDAAARQVNWWLRLTSFGWDRPQRTLYEREQARRSRLTSWIILGLMVVCLVLTPLGGLDPTALTAIGAVGAGLLLAAVLNRRGLVTGAGTLIVFLITGAIAGELVLAPGSLDTVSLPTYDLLGISVIVAASVLPRAFTFVVALINSGFIALDLLLYPKTPQLSQAIDMNGVASLMVRPIALQIILAVVAYLWVRGTDEAIRRADRAEELAQMEHRLVEQQRQLEVGVREILRVHVRVANGDYSARAPLAQDNVLFQIASSLNNLLNRLGRAGDAETLLRRTMQEIGRLRDSLLAARAGRAPLWPAPSGTPVDELINVIAGPTRQGGAGQIPGAATSGPFGPLAEPYPPRGYGGWPPRPPETPHAPGGTSDPYGFGAEPGPPLGQGGYAPQQPDASEWRPDPREGSNWGSSAPDATGSEAANSWDMPPLPDWMTPEDPNR